MLHSPSPSRMSLIIPSSGGSHYGQADVCVFFHDRWCWHIHTSAVGYVILHHFLVQLWHTSDALVSLFWEWTIRIWKKKKKKVMPFFSHSQMSTTIAPGAGSPWGQDGASSLPRVKMGQGNWTWRQQTIRSTTRSDSASLPACQVFHLCRLFWKLYFISSTWALVPTFFWSCSRWEA